MCGMISQNHIKPIELRRFEILNPLFAVFKWPLPVKEEKAFRGWRNDHVGIPGKPSLGGKETFD